MTDLLDRRKALHRKVEDAQNRCVQMQEQLEQLGPLAMLGLNWAMCAHEMNNLLMPICNYAQFALEEPGNRDGVTKSLQKILKLSQQAASVMEKVMSMAAHGQMVKERHKLTELLDDVFTCIGRDFSKDKIRVVRNVSDSVFVFAEKTSVQQVFLNLILNARQAMGERGGVLRLCAEQNEEHTSIEIADTGCGIEPERLKDIFNPFFTWGKQNGKGLGLAFCRQIIESHGGCITVESKPGQGTSFKILLPNETI